MVWIYGGALAHGNTAMYLGDALAKQGIVMVSMNYRVGRFGFFAFPGLAAEAPDDLQRNYGYYDQLAALKWVQRNVAAFGGDPKQVTIFGESAGGGSVIAHMVSPLSKGLFARAILQSPGVPTGRAASLPLSTLENAQATAIDYAKSLGITGTGADALKQLRALSTDDLLADASAQQVVVDLGTGHLPLGFPASILDGKFLTETPDAAIASGNWNKVPVLVGANSRDLGVGAVTTKEEVFALFGTKADDARKLYDPDGSVSFEELKTQVLADKTLVEPPRHLADLVTASGEPVWLYRFSYVAGAMRAQLPGTLHGFEIPYTMNLPAAMVGNKVTEDDKKMGALASAYWVSFAKSGDPNGRGRPNWPKYDPKANDQVFNFGNDSTGVVADPVKARLDLWSSIYDGK
jgi:para-nitrobenzyl esterase